MALAQLWLLSLGTYASAHGWRTYFEPATRPVYSLFSLDWRYFQWQLLRGQPVPCTLALTRPKRRC
ncbi:MAG: hypothetical protein JO316_15830 [Abitibacteriaceae bacterium]|nr:hypothetical protein [Abditibacteriaceae bacterium]